jgi:hypothetical protein
MMGVLNWLSGQLKDEEDDELSIINYQLSIEDSDGGTEDKPCED